MTKTTAGGNPTRMTMTRQAIWVAAILAFFGQLILQHLTPGSPTMGAGQLAAGTLLVAASVLFGLGAHDLLPRRPRLEFGGSRAQSVGEPWYRPWTWLAVALTPAVLAILVFIWQGETPLVIGLWIAGVVALVLIQLWRVDSFLPMGLREEWPYLLGALVVLLLAAFTRLYRLEAIPNNFDGDFASFGLEARALITGSQPQIFRFGWGPAPLLGALPGALGLLLFGDNLFGVRAAGLIPGLFSILGVYLLGRDFFNPRVGVIAAGLSAASYAHLAASRQIHYMAPVAFLTFALYFLILGLREEKGWAIVASGICTAMCSVYFPGRLVFPIIAVAVVFLFIFHRKALLRRRSCFILWTIAGLVALGPMTVVYIRQAEALLTHTSDVFILNPVVIRHSMGVYKVDTLPAMLMEQARRSVLMFHYYWDTDTQLAIRRPFLDPITAPLFTLGLGVALASLRRLGSTLLLGWTILGVLIGCFLTVNPAYWVRLLVLIPPAAILAALGIEILYLALAVRRPRRAWSFRAVSLVTIALLLVWIGYRNWNTYVDQVGVYATGPSRFARFMSAQPPDARGYLVSTVGWNYRMREFEYLIPGRLLADVTPEDVRAGLDPVGSPTLLVLTPEQTELLEQLPEIYPGGRLATYPYNSPDSVAFYVYTLP